VFNEYQMVRLKRPTSGLAAGTIGTVVMVYTDPMPGYEVEFCDKDGFTLALLTLYDDDLLAAPECGARSSVNTMQEDGLYFEILAVEPEKVYERRGRVQRIVGINRELFHHADAICVPESVFSKFIQAFRAAHPKFNYFGPTEYKRHDTVRLCSELRATPWAAPTSGNLVQDETEDVVQKILTVAEQALSNGQSLLVLGP
jgi:hypothetical protein